MDRSFNTSANLNLVGVKKDPNARIPVRPLEYSKYIKEGSKFEKELVADYDEKQAALYLILADGSIKEITSSSSRIIEELTKDPTLLGDINVTIQDPKGGESVKTINEAINGVIEEHRSMVSEMKSFKDSTSNNITNFKNTINNEIEGIKNLLNFIKENDEEDIDSITELVTWVNNHGATVTDLTNSIGTNATNIKNLNDRLTTLNSLMISSDDGRPYWQWISDELEGSNGTNLVRIDNIESSIIELDNQSVKHSQIIITTTAFEDYGELPEDAFLYIQLES